MKTTKYKRKTVASCLILLLFFCLFSACEGMTDNYKEYLEGGEIIYPGKADSVKLFPGKERVQLQWLILSDPSVTHFTAYWNNKKNAESILIDRTSGPQEVNLMVENLPEGTYTFEIFSFDRYSNRSVGREITGSTYGSNYRSKLLNRSIEKVLFAQDNTPSVTWGPAGEGVVSQEIRYLDKQGQEQLVVSAAEEEKAVLSGYDSQRQEGFNLTTVFIPEETAIDTFHCVPEYIRLTGLK